ncbi:MAG: thymidine kinase [Candidatus Phytoplasma asteris]|uniref:Thymidine kinase n=1 Tax='Chrysanthemum coronarium' phytoplasma TaxID=1520703 RepID=A0ABQ0J3R7_9MOLU|nr:thymidine kinase ['Chrysanthemum coronarium' phytoplasma]TKA87694.1 MAG: thymidine kinase [Periwinkle leaf yellowing phytoplasma]WEX20057.1 MAG: thymidine kinase [Candidatus Phytoplasma asteris]GAK74225.1 thymidine kinase ['Chrysanthemum coronarium' phytoplasma]
MTQKEQGQGFIEVVCGPMFAGKTEALIQRSNQSLQLNKKILSFKPRIDDRYSVKEEIVSHNQNTIPAILIDKSKDILPFITPEINVVIIDEAQFLDNDIVAIVDYLANCNIEVIISGLELDFCGKPFGPMPYLLAIADTVTKLTSICAISGKKANRTQRLIDGKPAQSNEPVVLVGGKEYHEPRCRKHHCLADIDKTKINWQNFTNQSK